MSHPPFVENRSHPLKPCHSGNVLPLPGAKESLVARLMRSKYCRPAKTRRIPTNHYPTSIIPGRPAKMIVVRPDILLDAVQTPCVRKWWWTRETTHGRATDATRLAHRTGCSRPTSNTRGSEARRKSGNERIASSSVANSIQASSVRFETPSTAAGHWAMIASRTRSSTH